MSAASHSWNLRSLTHLHQTRLLLAFQFAPHSRNPYINQHLIRIQNLCLLFRMAITYIAAARCPRVVFWEFATYPRHFSADWCYQKRQFQQSVDCGTIRGAKQWGAKGARGTAGWSWRGNLDCVKRGARRTSRGVAHTSASTIVGKRRHYCYSSQWSSGASSRLVMTFREYSGVLTNVQQVSISLFERYPVRQCEDLVHKSRQLRLELAVSLRNHCDKLVIPSLIREMSKLSTVYIHHVELICNLGLTPRSCILQEMKCAFDSHCGIVLIRANVVQKSG